MIRNALQIGFLGLLLFSHPSAEAQSQQSITLFLCGDVMLGRGIDQALPFPCEPTLHESYMKNAIGYLRLAEKENGRIPGPVPFAYIWGDALDELDRVQPDLRIINLETSITTSEAYWKRKGIHYRMNPRNIECLRAAEINFCSLANNHVLDWGFEGLEETLETLRNEGIRYGGAGLNRLEAVKPVVFDLAEKVRVIIYSCGLGSSGIPMTWTARENQGGVNRLNDLSDRTVSQIKEQLETIRQEGDILVVSIHWGGNWGYRIPEAHRNFAHQLIDEVNVDLIHGHSSHHVLGIEVYKDRPIIYGCGDFLNDYEGISGKEEYRDELGLMYFVELASESGRLLSLQLVPTQIRKFRVNRACSSDVRWLQEVLNCEGGKMGTRVRKDVHNRLWLQWK